MITAAFRVVEFVASPPHSPAIPIAALLRDRTHLQKPQLLLTRHPPDPARLGERSTATLQRILLDLWRVDSFDRLPASLGPHARLSAAAPVPRTAQGDAVAWLNSQVLVPHPSFGEGTLPEPLRTRRGARFFQTYGVADRVRESFWPAMHLPGWSRETLSTLPVISQYAVLDEPRELLLLEAIQRAEDARPVLDSLHAYEHAQARGGPGTVRLMAYLLPGVRERERSALPDDPQDQALLVDLSRPAERDGLLTLLRERAVVDPEQRGDLRAPQRDRPPT